MPPTKKKIVRKKAVRRKTAPKKTGHQTTRTKNRQLDNDSLTAELNQSIATTEMFPDQTTKQTHYIAVDADNDDLTKKNRLVWLIVAIIGLMITGFWFSTLRQNIAQTASAGDLKEIADQVSQNINEIKNIFSEVKATSQETVSQYQDLQQLEQLKTNTLKEIELNLDSAAWPENIEKSLNLSLKSPSGWTRKNDGQSIVIASYDDPNNLPESLGQLMITKRENPTKPPSLIGPIKILTPTIPLIKKFSLTSSRRLNTTEPTPPPLKSLILFSPKKMATCMNSMFTPEMATPI